MEEENYELLKIQLQVKVNEWDIFINRLKKSAPVIDANLEDMSTRRLQVRNVIERIQKSIPESNTTLSQLRQLKTSSRKLWSDFNDIYENYTEEDDNIKIYSLRRQALIETHSYSEDLGIADADDHEETAIAEIRSWMLCG